MESIIKSPQKQPLRMIEIPLRKFTEEVIPYHQKSFDTHKSTVSKLIAANSLEQAGRLINDKKPVLKQLNDLLYELDTLRTQVADNDLDIFDAKTLALRKIILTLKNGYADLQKRLADINVTQQQNQQQQASDLVGYNPFEGAEQIQIADNLDSLKLKQHERRLNQVEEIHRNVEDLHEISTQLHEMVRDQGEDVEHVAESVDSTRTNVIAGARHISKAYKLKAAAYPVTGAFLGSIVGGPVGMLAGFKIGGLAAIGCAAVGYVGGRFFKKAQDADAVIQQQGEVCSQTTDCGEKSGDDNIETKKDI